jgi:putative PEP-CTERM system TPR-repeat lipoprotein
MIWKHRIVRYIFICVAAVWLSGCSKTSIEEHMRRARETAANGDVPTSVIELKNVLQQDPNHVEARWLLARNYLNLGFGIGARKELRRIEDQRGDDPEYVVAVLQALLSEGRFEDVITRIEDLPADGVSARVAAAQTEAYVALGDRENAAEALARAESLAPDDPDVLLAKAIFAFANGDSAEAVGYARQAQSSRPRDPRAFIVEGRIQIPRGELTAAEAAFRAAVKLIPARSDAQAGVINALLAQGRAEEARAAAQKLVRQFPRAPLPQVLRATAQVMLGDNQAARDGLNEVLSLEPNNLIGRFLMARILFADGQLQQAEEMAGSVVKDAPASYAARKLYASVLIRNGRAGDAIALLEAAPAQTTQSAEGLEFMGMAYLEAGRIREATEFLAAAAEQKPDSAQIRSKLAFVKIAADDLDSALGDIAALVGDNADERRTRVLRLLVGIKKQHYDAVIAEAESLSQESPEDPLLHFILGVAYLGGEDRERAREEFLAALERDPKMASAMENLALVAHAEGDTTAEVDWLERALEVDPYRLKSQLALAQAKASTGDHVAALRILESVREAHPDRALPLVALARMYVALKDFPAALKAANEAAALVENNADVLLVRGYAELGTGDVKKALVTLEDAVRLAPDSPNAHYAMAAALHRAGRIADTRAELHTVLSKQENHLDSLRTLAQLEAAEGETERALEAATRIQQAFPDAVDGYVIEGDTRAATGTDDAGAAQAYDRALALGAGSDVVIRQYKLLMRQDQQSAALKKVAEWVEQHPDDVSGQFILALAYQQAGDTDRAISGYEKSLQLDDKAVGPMNNLAALYDEKGDPRALQLAEKAHSIHPDNPGVADTLGWIMLKRGKTRRAEELLRRALELLPAEPTIQYHLAVAYVQNGRQQDAIALLEKALEVDQFDGRSGAERLLKQVNR